MPSKIHIQTGALARLIKDLDLYKADAEKEKHTIAKLKDDKETDPYDLKQQEKLLRETELMFDPLMQRIEQSAKSLEQLLKSAPSDTNVEEREAAEKALTDAKRYI